MCDLGHELTHWVGSEKRLDRNLSRYHKDPSFRAHEELVADLGGCFLGIVPELEPRHDHASYLANWLEILSNENRSSSPRQRMPSGRLKLPA